MAIVVVPDVSSPLTQGDILKNVPFAVTTPSGDVTVDREVKYVLVISRPCRAIRQEALTVAPVMAFAFDLSPSVPSTEGGPSLDRKRRLLAGIRDGGEITDQLYLGTLEPSPSTKRFAVQLGTLATIHVPSPEKGRPEWIRERRVGRLQEEFCRDLHARLFNTYARMGFDDYAWYSDADLDVMINEGEAEIAVLMKSLTEARGAIHEKEAKNASVPEGLRKNAAAREDALRKAQEALKPYQEERESRQSSQAKLSSL